MEINDSGLSLNFGSAIFVVIFRIDRQYIGEGQAGLENDILRLGDIALLTETIQSQHWIRVDFCKNSGTENERRSRPTTSVSLPTGPPVPQNFRVSIVAIYFNTRGTDNVTGLLPYEAVLRVQYTELYVL